MEGTDCFGGDDWINESALNAKADEDDVDEVEELVEEVECDVVEGMAEEGNCADCRAGGGGGGAGAGAGGETAFIVLSSILLPKRRFIGASTRPAVVVRIKFNTT